MLSRARSGRARYGEARGRSGPHGVAWSEWKNGGDTHIHSASPAECADVRARFPEFTYEASGVFHVGLPDVATGACAAGTVPVYRVWDNRADTNHRYTTSVAVR